MVSQYGVLHESDLRADELLPVISIWSIMLLAGKEQTFENDLIFYDQVHTHTPLLTIPSPMNTGVWIMKTSTSRCCCLVCAA